MRTVSLLGTLLLVAAATTPESLFVDSTAKSGIKFVLRNSTTAEKHLIETMAGGVAVFDFDNDGFPDIYFVNGAEQPSLVKNGVQYYNRLYRNKGDWTFEDVTEKAGVCGHGYNFGVATADFDNDGFADILITSTNGNLLYRIRGDGTFEDVTEKAGVKGSGWSTAAAWLDYDNDGFQDLFAVRYVQWDSAREITCGDPARNLRTYCHPRFYEPLSNQLFHNNGDGTFTDNSEEPASLLIVGKEWASLLQIMITTAG